MGDVFFCARAFEQCDTTAGVLPGCGDHDFLPCWRPSVQLQRRLVDLGSHLRHKVPPSQARIPLLPPGEEDNSRFLDSKGIASGGGRNLSGPISKGGTLMILDYY